LASVYNNKKIAVQNYEIAEKMRNRTELVTNTGSDYDEAEAEFEADDGSDDWKPDPEVI
jgi:hypothetical protein